MTAVNRTATASRIVLGGALVDLMRRDDVVSAVNDRLGGGERVRPPGVPLAIGSANLDHVHHFGRRGRSAADIDVAGPTPEWLILLDGVPMVRRAASLTGRSWPLLAGSDLLPLLLNTAQAARARVGFLGGSGQMHDIVRPVLADRYPGLTVAGFWAPPRTDLADRDGAARLAALIREARVDLLVVGLGKPRQERWIQRHAGASGARVLLAFGAATDFLAGTATRAPGWVRRAGVEWLYRLSREPRRLARRYCVQGPPALWRLWTDSRR
ncbi:WecB/TagA/CpsF family glycosyltransferase [Rugosimonospora africana]|uniref:N-acetylglucosaminyldiphosphoundecaprenol N-acetyl-beta-D-mannosaminyltransferase n=1 Tax=Rugosimonospora africana TaxID=556532 RepID=A0A8J3VN80_9ACTN|nr:WecB/TagA/CpsF family glycosyltransferase [Rugosimonospora africana]GIH12939.1 hypothetical protein Raf01_11110 [Rugosimonospora africana]